LKNQQEKGKEGEDQEVRYFGARSKKKGNGKGNKPNQNEKDQGGNRSNQSNQGDDSHSSQYAPLND